MTAHGNTQTIIHLDITHMAKFIATNGFFPISSANVNNHSPYQIFHSIISKPIKISVLVSFART